MAAAIRFLSSIPARSAGSPARERALCHLRAGELHHLAPLLGFVGDELGELGGGAGQQRGAELQEARLRLVSARIAFTALFSVSMISGASPSARRGRTRRSPRSRHVLRDGRKVRQHVRSLGRVTASPRSLPDLMNSAAVGTLSNITCTCPPTMSVSASAPPRYGTWIMSVPVIILNSSPDMWRRAVAG